MSNFIRTGQLSSHINLPDRETNPGVLSPIFSVGPLEDGDSNAIEIEDGTAQFSGNINLPGRETNPGVLSTILSVGSLEDGDSNAIEIEDGLEAGNTEKSSEPAREVRERKPTHVQRTISGPMPSAMRGSTASRSSTIRSSTSSVGLPTVTEMPVAVVPRDGNATPIDFNAPTTPVQAVAVPVVSFSDPETISRSQSPPLSNSRSPIPTVSHTTLPGWPLHSDSDGKRRDCAKSSVTVAPSMNDSSRFEWDLSRTQKAKGFVTRWFVEWWLLEIISWIFSAICMAIILSVLLHFNGRPMPAWKLGLTLNSFISILSGFAKASLLLPTAEALGQLKWNWFSKPRPMMDFEVIDSASRGPLGSMVLLANTKGITLASVGAAIILLSLPLDLFFQQIVTYPTTWIKAGNASIPRAIYYDPAPNGQHNALESSLLPDHSTLAPDTIMVGAVFPYLWLNPYNGQAVLNITCPTSRCTWSPFNTLGVCSRCMETPNLLDLGCKLTPNNWLNNTFNYPYSNESTDGYIDVNSCGWYLTPPNGPPLLMSGYSMGNSTTNSSFIPQVLMGRAAPLRDVYTRELLFDRPSINFPDIQNPIMDFVASGTPGGIEGAKNNATPVVHECILYWCVNTISAALIDSRVVENITNSVQVPSTFSNNPWRDAATSWYESMFSLVLPDAQVPGGYANFSVNNVTARLTYQSVELIIPHSWLQGFQGLDSNPVSPGEAYVKWQWRIVQSIFLQLSNINATQWLPPGNVSQLVTSLAQAMSVSLRRTAIGFTTEIPQWQGDAWEQETRVHIRWAWIILPACLLIFSFLFLAVTIIRSEKGGKKIGIWKSSALAVLFNGLGEDVQDSVGTQTNLGYARAKAKQINVQLDES